MSAGYVDLDIAQVLKQTLDCLGQPVAAVNRHGVFLYVNRAARNASGLGLGQELVGRNLRDVCSEAQARQIMAGLRKVLKTNQGIGLQSRVKSGDRPRWNFINIQPIRDHAGKSVAAMILSHDVTEHMRMRAQLGENEEQFRAVLASLRESEERYRGLLESQNDLIVRVDSKGRFTYVNDAYCRKFGKTKKQLLNRSYTPLVHKDDRQAAVELVKSLNVPPYRGSLEQRARTAAGWRWIQWEDCAVLDEQGRIVEVQAVGRDITELKEVEQALRESHGKLMMAREEERRRLASELHDSIGQRLAVMQMKLVSVLKLCEDSPNAHALASTIESNAATIAEVRSLCHGLYPPTLDELGLASALRRMKRDCHGAADLSLRISPRLAEKRFPREVEIALFRISQEAVSNAIRHSAATEIEISLQTQRENLTLKIRDSGRGFEPLQVKGNGIGMHTMRERARAVGAKLDIESKPGKTVLKVVLPLKRMPRDCRQ